MALILYLLILVMKFSFRCNCVSLIYYAYVIRCIKLMLA